ncbi:MAG: chloride channel protein, partial [Bacteroidales bacterium]|nr:chloride channel protein [Bacteroidales bacterium]
MSKVKDIFPFSENYSYFILPLIGIFLTIIVIKYIFKDRLGEGVPKVLYAISRKNAIIKRINMITSIIGSALTVGFGGSAGLEGPTIATGAAVGSNIGQALKLTYRQTALMIAIAAAAALAAIFKSPIAAIIFVMEVLMLDLTMVSLVPLLVATVTATLFSYLLLGKDVIYSINLTESFQLNEFHLFILLGIIMGVVSACFTKVYKSCHVLFNEKIKGWVPRLLIGSVALGILIFLISSFYGEGFDAINLCLHGNYQPIFSQSFFARFGHSFWLIAL